MRYLTLVVLLLAFSSFGRPPINNLGGGQLVYVPIVAVTPPVSSGTSFITEDSLPFISEAIIPLIVE